MKGASAIARPGDEIERQCDQDWSEYCSPSQEGGRWRTTGVVEQNQEARSENRLT